VHTPEFAFEHVASNVRAAVKRLGIHYPVVQDNDYGTWDAYNNEYWPAEYLLDQTGQVRAYDFGEGGYATMEDNIRSLLAANGTTDLPAKTAVANKTPTAPITQESYVGYQEESSAPEDAGVWVGTPFVQDKKALYHAPSSIPSNDLALNGTWTDHRQEATAGKDASIELNFTADDVYLVLAGTGTVTVSLDGHALKAVHVSGVPTLYTLFSSPSLQTGLLTLGVSPGVQAYDFTFG